MKDRAIYIQHIWDCIQWIQSYIVEGKEAFLADHKTQDAVIRNIEIIGQAAKDLGVETLSPMCASVPWRQIADTRNFLAHQYLGVDMALVWNIIEHDLPQLEICIILIAKTEGVHLEPFDNQTKKSN
jgi:uncharacterized protein with HEPN domain